MVVYPPGDHPVHRRPSREGHKVCVASVGMKPLVFCGEDCISMSLLEVYYTVPCWLGLLMLGLIF